MLWQHIDLGLLLLDGAVLCLFIGMLVAGSFARAPRMWLRDLPADIQSRTAPMTHAEVRSAQLIGVVIVSLLFCGQVVSTLRYGFEHGYLLALLHAYLLFQIFNFFDFLVIDCGIMLAIDPADPPIEGTAHAAGYRNFVFHALASLKGLLLGLPFAALAAGVAWLITAWV
ncbi:MAG: hypothetical protein AAF513_04300 [Pseudomonadota bacterium]